MNTTEVSNIKRTKIQLHTAILLIAAVLLVFTIGYIIVVSLQKASNGNDDIVHTVAGTVTGKRTSCGEEKLLDDGTVKRMAGICDAGNGLTVNGVYVFTGGGAMTGEKERISDISLIHPGDNVEIRYVQDKYGQFTTNCESCYVKVR